MSVMLSTLRIKQRRRMLSMTDAFYCHRKTYSSS
jgi:hypothetical protein